MGASEDPRRDKRDYDVRYQIANRERINARRRARYAKDPEKHRARSSTWRTANPDKHKEANLAWRRANKNHITEQRVRTAYGLTPEEQRALRASHKGGCAICGGPGGRLGLCIDHDHGTGKVRGLLCAKCNTGIGCFADSPARLRKAASYLAKGRS